MIGLMRVKNEARWIVRSVQSILPVCDRVFVFDDHSTDGTLDLIADFPRVIPIHSPFTGLDETRDKNFLLDYAEASDWVLMIDGDEELTTDSIEPIRACMKRPNVSYALRVLYLWDREDQVRTDGVYGKFWRASMFIPGSERFSSTHAGGNFHCGNVPISIQPFTTRVPATLLHYGYMDRADRLRKYDWYTKNDPGNPREDGYRHMVQGDLPEVPAGARLMHAGPLTLEAL